MVLMRDDTGNMTPTDVADGLLDATQAEAFLKENPSLAAEVEIARRVRALMSELRAAAIEVPADFEAPSRNPPKVKRRFNIKS
jgi:anti-sigma factor RsiW